jgi:hypothetical protein
MLHEQRLCVAPDPFPVGAVVYSIVVAVAIAR